MSLEVAVTAAVQVDQLSEARRVLIVEQDTDTRIQIPVEREGQLSSVICENMLLGSLEVVISVCHTAASLVYIMTIVFDLHLPNKVHSPFVWMSIWKRASEKRLVVAADFFCAFSR